MLKLETEQRLDQVAGVIEQHAVLEVKLRKASSRQGWCIFRNLLKFSFSLFSMVMIR